MLHKNIHTYTLFVQVLHMNVYMVVNAYTCLWSNQCRYFEPKVPYNMHCWVILHVNEVINKRFILDLVSSVLFWWKIARICLSCFVKISLCNQDTLGNLRPSSHSCNCSFCSSFVNYNFDRHALLGWVEVFNHGRVWFILDLPLQARYWQLFLERAEGTASMYRTSNYIILWTF